MAEITDLFVHLCVDVDPVNLSDSIDLFPEPDCLEDKAFTGELSKALKDASDYCFDLFCTANKCHCVYTPYIEENHPFCDGYIYRASFGIEWVVESKEVESLPSYDVYFTNFEDYSLFVETVKEMIQ